jgi:hypothetical protein
MRVWLLVVLCACGEPGPDPGTDAGRDGSIAPGQDAGPGLAPRHERYISSATDTRLVIELDYVDGSLPRAGAEDDLIARLSTLLDKPDGIEIVHDDVLTSRGGDHAWTFEELRTLAAESFDDDGPAGTIAMHVMWIDGHSADDTASGRVLGLAWGHRFIAMFHDTLEDACTSSLLMQEAVCRSSQYLVWLHEVGHTIGLVDNGLAMVTDHKDDAHGAHDASDQCLMYWAFEGESGVGLLRDRLLGGGPMIDFDAQCLADVAAVRDR